MINLSDPIQRQQLTFQIKKDINEACVEHFKEGPREHLGASIIGHNCSAYLWNNFRWLKQEVFDGKQYRLFNRGHLEEDRFIKWLQLAGFRVWDKDSNTGKQFRIHGCDGHFGGSLDSILEPPARYDIQDYLIWLGEFKTHNDKSFKKLVDEGVRKSKPQHFKQMCSYGKLYNFPYGLYCAVNKNDDDLYFEIVELDFSLADDLFRKAEEIIYSQTQPRKIAQTETFFDCKWCNFVGICHRGEIPEKNCRSCANAIPTEQATWTCQFHNQKIPTDIIPIGCDSYRRII